MNTRQMTPLQDLTLLHRFLFSEAVEDPQFLEDVLSIIIGEDIVLKELPQTEKEIRNTNLRKYVRLDVWAKDEHENIYDAEVQREDTKNLPKRSRFYQALMDSRLLEAGDTEYEKLNRVHMIMIAPFDLFGKKRYKYTFQMACSEEPDVFLNDGAYRIFLNTHGTDDKNISPELKALLEFFENPSEEVANRSGNERIKRMQKRVKSLKESEEVGVKYMREWEEKIFAKREAREEGLAEGRAEGRAEGLAEGRAEGRTEGLAEGRDRINKLNELLLEAGRIDDLKESIRDGEFQKKLLEEFGL